MRFTKPKVGHAGNHANRLLGPIIALSLATIGTAVYLSPASSRGGPTPAAAAESDRVSGPGSSSRPSTSAARSVSRLAPRRSSSTSSSAPSSGPSAASSTNGPNSSSSANRPTKELILRQTTRVTVTSTPDSVVHCYQFKFQQDAQAAYLANLSDPSGLDGAPGPNNGDGLACTGMASDPTRPLSTPADAYSPPPASPSEKNALVRPALDYFGVTQDGLPNATSQLTTIDTELKKAPSAIGYFATWDAPFNASQVITSWRSGALPVMTWESKSSISDNDPAYSFTNILAGNWDNYLYKFAGDVVRTNLPLVIRFDHEMNGSWYPWSAGMTVWNNSPSKYIAVWQHVWNIFQQVGANNDVIWDWSPARVDTLNPHSTGISQISADYPGDAYVDWAGATVYWRHSNVATDYATSFAKTIGQIRAVTHKPLFFAEIGALQTDGGDQTVNKSAWIRNAIAGFLADPSIVGFLWFDNIATTPDDPFNPHDWRFDATPGTLAEFKGDVGVSQFASGILPDSLGT